jgi:hypothetical protein
MADHSGAANPRLPASPTTPIMVALPRPLRSTERASAFETIFLHDVLSKRTERESLDLSGMNSKFW